MRPRNSRVRAKVTALLMSLVALWAFAALVTLREGLDLLSVNTLYSKVSQPAERLTAELQQERRLSLVHLGTPDGTGSRTALRAQRARTDVAGAAFQQVLTDDSVRDTASPGVMQRIVTTDQAYRRLVGLRPEIDEHRAGRYATEEAFAGVIEGLYHIHDGLSALDDDQLAQDTRALLALARARELLSREDAQAAGALATGGFDVTDGVRFAQAAGAQRLLLARAGADLPEDVRPGFRQLADGESMRRLRTLEDRLIQNSWAGERIRVDPASWDTATKAVISRLDKLITAGGDTLVDRATPLAFGVIVRLVLAGGLGLLAVIFSIILSITTARDLVRRLEQLRGAALDLAGRRLPGVVARLGRGEDVDVATEAPPLTVGNDAIGQVGQAFNTVQETAVRVAVEQAELRRGYRAILLNLARRTQSLVHRQLGILDAMERRATEPAELADLFRVDHLATRMRRNAENLIVLSGASPGRAWRRSVPMVDVVRGALAEIEDYTQVTLMPMGEAELAGRAIGDVIHLLAELIENAVSFSPPYATVQVSGQEVGKGYVVEIEDRGLGMSEADLAVANARIAEPPEFRLTDTPRLGLFVVSRLAARHDIQVTLKSSPYGGTTVIVLIPRELINGDSEAEPGMDAMTERAGAPGEPGPGGAVVPSQGRQALPPAPRDGVNGAGVNGAGVNGAGVNGAGVNGAGVNGGGVNGGGTPHDVPETVQAGDHVPAEWAQEWSGGATAGGLPRRRAARPAPAPAPAGSPDAGEAAPPAMAGHGPVADGGPVAATGPGPVADGGPVAPAGASEPAFTPSGLPRRVAQANLAPGLREDPPPPPEATAQEDDGLSPDDLRRLMASFQSGTERARSEAAGRPRPAAEPEPPIAPR
ncbi:hypothetical protein Sru01_08810 [Sphaerisporangium rufum]|uniref:histidine kinase n=1 Tax=Sphaerisporangium rufum TaxID=1381558 RepID=A0A919UXJ1_9ACTN|nr:sensor histidine kinase [Sphaerisporangium rufum]GII75899.1 hypothetical protein Sru01_08810 [Sphaerisporangium rufum]